MRVAGWEKALADVFDDWELKPFEWGSTDCAHFAHECVAATSGKDLLDTLKGAYATPLASVARLRYRGFCSVEEWLADACERLGFPPVPIVAAAAGDLGITAEGIVCVRHTIGFVARARDGRYCKVVPKRAWSVR